MAQVVHKRAFVAGRGVAWCRAGQSFREPGILSDRAANVTCSECLRMMGRAPR